jgi:hypothetical protein
MHFLGFLFPETATGTFNQRLFLQAPSLNPRDEGNPCAKYRIHPIFILALSIRSWHSSGAQERLAEMP